MMMVCFFSNWIVMPPPAAPVIGGFVPSCPGYAVLQLVGTVGAVIMPHNIYLHSALVKSRGVDRCNEQHVKQSNRYFLLDSALALAVSFFINLALMTSFSNGFFLADCAQNLEMPLACVPGVSPS